MEPTEAQIETAARAMYAVALPDFDWDEDAGSHMKDVFREEAGAAVRAAFATVPDPTKLADKWDGWELADSDYADGMKDCAAELRAFMRGES